MTLRLDSATVRRGRAETLSAVSLSLAPGETVALLGHNGAGKTTLMHAALGLLPLAAGRIEVAGHAPGSHAARAATAYLPESVAFHPALTGREQLSLFARLRGLAAGPVAGLLDRVGLAAAADRRIGAWSKGMRQRLGLAQVLLGRPALALLDEPTSGLDPVSRGEFYEIVAGMAAAGTTVLISSHALSEIEARCERIALLRNGRLVADETLAGLRARAALPIRLRVTVRAGEAGDVAEALGGTRMNGRAVDILCPPERKIAMLGQVTALGAAIEDVEMALPGLEDLYRHFNPEAPE